MEVILTLSNRITLAGALPLLVAIALSALIAAIVLAPSRPASAAISTKTCGLDPVLLDVLLDRYGKKSQECDTLNPVADTALDDDDFDPAVWQFDGRELTEFAISKDDSDVLKEIHENTSGFPTAVKYIDLTGNPLTIEDVNFANIPATVAVILSADSNVNGFQASEYTVTEGSPSYVAVAFPGATVASGSTPTGTLQPAFTITGRDAVAAFGTNAFLTGSHLQLIDFGDQEATDVAARTAQVNAVSDNRIFYLPLQANKDNDNREDWDFKITITDPVPGADTAEANAFELANDEAEITVLDADAPSLSVCDRSEHVEAAILALTESPSPANLYGSHTKCDDLTLRDLGEIPGLNVLNSDDTDEPIADLIAGDFEGLAKAATLSITGAGALPSGIFAGVGKDATGGVEITFAKNNTTDEDVVEVGKYTPRTIPQHIFDDQEVNQIIILDDDLNDEKKGVTSGLDATTYSVMEGSQFFVLTPALQTYYVLGKSAVLGSAASTPDIDTARRGDANSPKVARYAVPATKDALDDDNANDESMVLFLFNAATPADTGSLVDIALVTVIDDD